MLRHMALNFEHSKCSINNYTDEFEEVFSTGKMVLVWRRPHSQL